MREDLQARVQAALAALEAEASSEVRDQMGPRFGIVTADRTLGVRMEAMQALARRLGRDPALAEALWTTGVYEARITASMVADPVGVTPEQMERWRADFDNWAVTDTVCLKLFDRAPHAAEKALAWTALNDEFGRRAGFALLAGMAIHRRGDAALFHEGLRRIEAAATDERNFVKKAVNWALRAIGLKGNDALKAEARAVAERLAASDDRTARWVGRDAMKAFDKADQKVSGR
jgi:3-methyladenine DNA glycosylase AlkD